MVYAFSLVIALTLLQQLVGAKWVPQRIGGGGGSSKSLVCPSGSWIVQFKGGISYGWIRTCLTQFDAKCSNGKTLGVCGITKTRKVQTIFNANGFDSVTGYKVSYKVSSYVADLSFYHNYKLIGSIKEVKSQRTLACPENEVIMGVSVRCGAIVDSIQVYCGSPKGYPTEIPTLLPTPMPTNPPTSMPTNPPTSTPTNAPTLTPTNPPTVIPTIKPTGSPTSEPTENPTVDPTVMPTNSPSEKPTSGPTYVPTWMPTIQPTLRPTASCPENLEKLEIVIDYLMDYLYCMKHAPNPDECSGTYDEFAILNTVREK